MKGVVTNMSKMRNKNNKNKQSNKYNAENEIIIGVTTKPKENVRVEKKKTTRTNKKTNKKKNNIQNKKNVIVKNKKVNKNTNQQIDKEEHVKKLNRKKIIISIGILLFIIVCGTIYYLTTPVFNVSRIIVYGNNKNSVDTYISLSGIILNETNIFAFKNSSVEKRIKENPYVEKVEIERKLPNVIELHIKERNIDYQVSNLNSYVYINNQGYILEINEGKGSVPIIEGLVSIKNKEVGQRLDNEDLIKLDTILKITNYLKYNSVESKLTSVDASDVSNYILEFKKEKKIAYIGDSSSITEKMTAVSKILEAEEGKKGKIYANEEFLKKNRVYFREEK